MTSAAPPSSAARNAPPVAPAATTIPKLLLLVNPMKEGHGLMTNLKNGADVVRPLRDDSVDAVFSFGVRSLALMIISYHELQHGYDSVVEHLNQFQHKSQLPYAVLISSIESRTPAEYYKLESDLIPGRLKIILAKNVQDAASAVLNAVSAARDPQKRVNAASYFNQLSQQAQSTTTLMNILDRVSEHIGMDNKDMYRIFNVYANLKQLSMASGNDLLKTCPIERTSATLLADFLDGRPNL